MVGDKKRQKAYTEMLRLDEPAGRIKKDLLKEYKFNVPGDQVLILGMSSAPFDAVKKDKKAFVGFFQKHIYCPLPDYGSRVLLWRALVSLHSLTCRHACKPLRRAGRVSESSRSESIPQCTSPQAERAAGGAHRVAVLRAHASFFVARLQFEKHGAPLSREFDVSTLAKVTEGYTSGDIDRIVRTIATESRIDRLHHGEESSQKGAVTKTLRATHEGQPLRQR